ncbi:MAG: GAF domain-containing protein [Anaerolineales bacterium]|nr:GAF domain-containing protein [Anaerolineales bacterium]
MSQNPVLQNPSKKGLPFFNFKFFRNMSLRNRLLLAFIALALVPMLINSSVSATIGTNGLKNEIIQGLQSIATLKEEAIREWLETVRVNLRLAGNDKLVRQGLNELLQNNPEATVSPDELRNELIAFNKNGNYFVEIFLISPEGKVVLSTDSNQEGKIQITQAYFQEGLLGEYTSPPSYEVSRARYSIILSEPLKNASGRTIGVLAGRVNLDTLSGIMAQATGLGEEGETYLVTANNAVLTQLAYIELIPGETYIRTEGITKAIQEKSAGSATYVDYAGNPVFGAYRWIPELQVALIAEHNQSAALAATNRITLTVIGIAIVTILLALFIAYIVARGITTPIADLAEIADKVSHGDLTLQADASRKDEIGVLAESFNTMTSRLRELIGSLEQRISDRTKALATSTEVSRRLSSLLVEADLVKEVVEQVKTSFNYYHAHIYLLNQTGDELLMAGGTGEAGKTMLANKHKIAFGKGLVGRAAETNAPVLVADTTNNPDWLPNPLLPETKSEVAIPISIEDRVLGVLDVQQNVTNGLSAADADLLQAISNQIAIALQNARTLAGIQQQANREQLIASINQKIISENNVEGALQVAVREIGRALGTRAAIRLTQSNGQEE